MKIGYINISPGVELVDSDNDVLNFLVADEIYGLKFEHVWDIPPYSFGTDYAMLVVHSMLNRDYIFSVETFVPNSDSVVWNICFEKNGFHYNSDWQLSFERAICVAAILAVRN